MTVSSCSQGHFPRGKGRRQRLGVWAEPGYWFQRLAACRCACIGSCHFPCYQNFCQRAGAIIKRTDPFRKVHALRPLPASPPSVPHRQVPDLDGLSRTACGCKAGVVDLKLVFQFSIRAMRPGGALHSPTWFELPADNGKQAPFATCLQ